MNDSAVSCPLVLTEVEKLQLKLLVDDFPVMAWSRYRSDARMLAIIHQYASYLPRRLGLFLLNFRYQPGREGMVVVQNLPDADIEGMLVLLMSSLADVCEYPVSERDYTALFSVEQSEMRVIDHQFAGDMRVSDSMLHSIAGVRDVHRKVEW